MNEYFPTEFARKISKRVDLFPIKEIDNYDVDDDRKSKRVKAREAHDKWERLAEFQNLSISGEFKEAIIAY